MKHGSLFSGIGGFDLAAQWMGWENLFHCEWDEFCQKILNFYWPNAKSYKDIRETDFSLWRGKIDILTGGFPCQPYSVAGERKGTDDERHLWPEMLRAVRECRPSWVVGENVTGLISWGKGLVFEQVCLDLEDEGYKVQPVILPACAKNAPHKRDRVWFIAYSDINRNCNRSLKVQGESERQRLGHKNKIQESVQSGHIWSGVTANSNSIRQQGGKIRHKAKEGSRSNEKQSEGCHFISGQDWQEFPTQSAVYNGDDGFPPDWTILPFQNGKTNQSKPEEMQ